MALDIVRGSVRSRALGSTLAALAGMATLPGQQDFETTFHPGRAYVRRASGHNLWILYRFDSAYVDILTVRGEPPVPIDEE